jgi:hypothetical protein
LQSENVFPGAWTEVKFFCLPFPVLRKHGEPGGGTEFSGKTGAGEQRAARPGVFFNALLRDGAEVAFFSGIRQTAEKENMSVQAFPALPPPFIYQGTKVFLNDFGKKYLNPGKKHIFVKLKRSFSSTLFAGNHEKHGVDGKNCDFKSKL